MKKLFLTFCILIALLSLVSCNSCGTHVVVPPVKTREINKINFFMDNSGSMTGYLKGDAEFKGTILDILTDANKIKPIKIKFISDNIKDYPGTIGEFIDEIAKSPEANGHSSQMDVMFDNIINSTDSNDISMFVSDCILSYTDNEIKQYRARNKREINKDNIDGLRSKNKMAFSNAIDRKHLCATVYGFRSKFFGKYFYYDNSWKDFTMSGVSRPYYLWVIGNKEVLAKFNNKLKDFPTFKPEDYTTFQLNSEPLSNYSILFQTEKTGEWRPENDNCIVVNELPAKSKPVKLALAVDLSSLPAYARSEQYLGDNLKITPYPCGEIKVKKASVIVTNQAREQKMLRSATNVFVITLTGNIQPNDKINIVLPMGADTTFNRWSTDDDKVELTDKTFALRHLIKGVNDAYHTSVDDKLINIQITIKK